MEGQGRERRTWSAPVIAWWTGAIVALVVYGAIMTHKSGVDAAYVLIEQIGLAICPSSFAWVADGQWTFQNEKALLLFVPVMNGFVYSGVAAVIVNRWKSRRWLAVLGVAMVAGWWTLCAVDYVRWIKLIRSGGAEE